MSSSTSIAIEILAAVVSLNLRQIPSKRRRITVKMQSRCRQCFRLQHFAISEAKQRYWQLSRFSCDRAEGHKVLQLSCELDRDAMNLSRKNPSSIFIYLSLCSENKRRNVLNCPQHLFLHSINSSTNSPCSLMGVRSRPLSFSSHPRTGAHSRYNCATTPQGESGRLLVAAKEHYDFFFASL